MDNLRTIQLPSGLEFVMLRSGYIDKLIEGYGEYEYYDIDFLVGLVRDSRKPLTVLDIGANNGIFSVAVAKSNPLVHVHAFEPDKDMVKDILAANISANNLLDRISIVPVAVGDSPGMLELYVDCRDVFNSLVKANITKGSTSYLVEAIALDDYFKDHASIDIIKIDVQGYELQAFKGASKTLSNDDAPLILFEGFEHHARGAGNSVDEIVAFLKQMGYTIYLFVGTKNIKTGIMAKPGTIIPIADVQKYCATKYPFSNYIAVKNKFANKIG